MGELRLSRFPGLRGEKQKRVLRLRCAPLRMTIYWRGARSSAREDGFVAEDAIEGGAADAELAGGAELVAAVEVEDILDVMLDDGVEVEAVVADVEAQLGG